MADIIPSAQVKLSRPARYRACRRLSCTFCVRASLLLAFALVAQAADPLRLVHTIPLTGVQGRIDHMAVDVAGRRLFVAALGNNTVEVVDISAGKRAHTITGLHEPQGIAYVPDRNRIYVANGEDGTLKIYDGSSYAVVGAVDFGRDADNVRYDAAARQVYVGYGDGSLGIVDEITGKRTGDIPLSGHPESFQLEQSSRRIFVNVPTAGHVAVVDRHGRSVTVKWPLPGNPANFPMALDEAGRTLFVGCRRPAHVAVFDTGSGKLITTVPCAGDTDDLFYDAALRRLYVSGGEGFLSIIARGDHGSYQSLAKIPTAGGARTSLFVPQLKRLYLAVPYRGAQHAEIRVYETQP